MSATTPATSKEALPAGAWDEWVLAQGLRPRFVQLAGFGEILDAAGYAVDRLVVRDDFGPALVALVVFLPLRFGWRFAFVQKGPIFRRDLTRADRQAALRALGRDLVARRCVFLRCEPDSPGDIEAGWRAVPVQDETPRVTLLLDLRPTADELLAAMHKHARYGIRFAARQGVRVVTGPDPDSFLQLMKQTAARHAFALQRETTYRGMIQAPHVTQVTGHHEGPAATALFLECGDTMFYVFAASDHDQRRVMAPYAVLWEGIVQARRKGLRTFDFWGIAPPEQAQASGVPERSGTTPHRYASFTEFKLRFGGTPSQDAGTYDVVLFPLRYRISRLLGEGGSIG